MTEGGPPPQHWCIITPEYPPLPGGIGDHSWLLAQALTAAGDTVEVWTPPGPRAPALDGVTVHVLPSEYGLDALRVLRDALRALPAGARVLVQYAPTAFGMRRLNVPFALLLYLHARRGVSFDLYFHGGGYPIRFRQAPGRSIAALLHRLMTWLVVRGARRVFVAIPEWQRHLRRLGIRESDRDRVVTWSPVPSNVPDRADPERVKAIRASIQHASAGDGRPGSSTDSAIVGHFGRYGAFHQRILPRVIERLLDARRTRIMLLVGFGSGAVRDAVAVARPDLAARIIATGHVDAAEVSAYLAACDVLLQPYEDGASTSHSSLIAGLALGRAVVSNIGSDTGPIWRTRRTLWLTKSHDADDLVRAVGTVLDDASLRASLGAEGRALYQELFAMARGVTRLRTISPGPVADEAVEMELPPMEPVAIEPSEPDEPPDEGSPRVLMVLAAPFDASHPLRGAAYAAHRLANMLVALGASVTVASIGAPPPDAAYAWRALPGRGLRRLLAPLATGVLPIALFDVVHHHGRAPILRRVRPTVQTLYADPTPATSLAARVGRAASRILARVSLLRADAVVTTGAGDFAARATRTILGGVDVAPPDAAPRAVPVPRILFVGDLLGERRGRWLYDLYRERIAPRRPDVELHLIADVAPPSHPGMRFEALTADADFPAAYAGASVLAAPSTLAHADAALLEAMAAGVPVVATPTPGASELLGNGRFGLLADDAVFADAILRLLDDDAMHGRLAAAGRGRAESLSWRKVAEQYLTLYVSLMIGATEDVRPMADATPRKLTRALTDLVSGAASLIDVGAGSGEPTLLALAQEDVRRVLAVETREHERRSIRRALAAEGYALDPRLELSPDPIAARSDDGGATLDDHAAGMDSPLLIRVADPEALDAVLAGATLTLDRHATRWMIAVPDALREQYEVTFRVKGYDVRHLRTRSQHWIVAVRR